jgi:hypothetical protein
LTALFKWQSRKADSPAPAPAQVPAAPVVSVGTVTTSKVLPRFLATLGHVSDPVLLDLGPVVGSNVAFFGERLACKIFVEDLIADVETFARRGDREALADHFATRLTQPDDSVDGILCWDLFDYLDRRAGQVLAAKLGRLLRAGGVVHGFFGTSAVDLAVYTRYAIEAEDTLRLRTTPATSVHRNVLLTRDINKMFDGLLVAESVLLKSNTRETLFRRPADGPQAPAS